MATLLLARVSVQVQSQAAAAMMSLRAPILEISYLTVKGEEDGNYTGSNFGVIVGIVRERLPDSRVMNHEEETRSR